MTIGRVTGERCAACGGYILTSDQRYVVDGLPYHIFCSRSRVDFEKHRAETTSDPLLVEVAGYLATEEPTYRAWELCAMTDDIGSIWHDLDNMVLNLSEEPNKFRQRLLDLATVTLALIHRIDGEKGNV